jgi:TetR/AcrR family transcriptional regulator, cholesterol catabolism regulator
MARVSEQEADWAKGMVDNTHCLERYFLHTIAEGVGDGSFRSDLSVTLMANSIFGMTQWTHRWWVPGKSRHSAEDLISTFTGTFLEGIERNPADPRSADSTTDVRTATSTASGWI